MCLCAQTIGLSFLLSVLEYFKLDIYTHACARAHARLLHIPKNMNT